MTLPRNPVWHRSDRLHRDRIPPRVRAWLLDAGSLTAHVRACCPGRFRLRVLRERWTYPRVDEAAALGIPRRRRVRIREVALCCGDEPMVFARTVIPPGTQRGPRQRLAGIGNRPLGALLFADRSMRREPFYVARLTLAQAGLPAPAARHRTVWGRRAVFRLGGAPLLVAEFFMPALVEGTSTG